jgi:hypothetical protein
LTQTGSAVSSIDFTSGIDATFNEYLFVLSGILPGTNATSLVGQISTDGGATWKAGGTDYFLVLNTLSSAGGAATNTPVGVNGTTNMVFASSLSNNTGCVLGGEVRLFTPSSGTLNPVSFALTARDLTNINLFTGSGGYNAGTPANGFRFKMSAGTMSGTISLYGMRK